MRKRTARRATLEWRGGTFIEPSRRAWLAATAFAAAVFSLLAFGAQSPDRHTSDFYSFWAGAKLAGPHLYESARAEAIQRSVSPLVESKRYIRPPFYAVALWPLGRLPFDTAYAAWCGLNIAAALAFAWLWRPGPAGILACGLFLPLGWSFGLGQDAPLLLLAVAVGARLVERGREVEGGAVLALCAVKPHLFLFVPVALVAQRRFRALAGMSAAATALYLVSAAMLGPAWPVEFMRAALGNEETIAPRLLGLTGVIARDGAPQWPVAAALAVAGVAIVWRQSRRTSWLPAIAFAVAAGVVFAPRALVYDGALFLPLLLLRFRTAVVAIIGAVFVLVVTPAAILAQTTAVAILWLSGKKSSPLPTGKGKGTKD